MTPLDKCVRRLCLTEGLKVRVHTKGVEGQPHDVRVFVREVVFQRIRHQHEDLKSTKKGLYIKLYGEITWAAFSVTCVFSSSRIIRAKYPNRLSENLDCAG